MKKVQVLWVRTWMVMPWTGKSKRLWPGPWSYYDTLKQVPNLSVLRILGKRHLTFPLPNEGTKYMISKALKNVASLRFGLVSTRYPSRYPTASLPNNMPSDTTSFLTYNSFVWVSGFPCHFRKAWGAVCFHGGEYSERWQKLKPSMAPLWNSGNCEAITGKTIKVIVSFRAQTWKKKTCAMWLKCSKYLTSISLYTLTSVLWNRSESWKTKAEV